jgi:hypothetical protein
LAMLAAVYLIYRRRKRKTKILAANQLR